MGHLQELYERFRDKGLVVLGFNASDDRQIALDFMHENGATFPNILDASDAARQVNFQDYRSSGVPLNYIIDREGKIVDAWYGYEEGHKRATAALEKAGMGLADIQLIELNEAFAAQYIACERKLGIDRNITNVNGSGISLGHPVGCTGLRIVVSLIYEMIRRDVSVGLATLCVGGGMGMATIVARD